MNNYELLSVRDIKVGKRYRKDLGDLDALVNSITETGGLLHPIVVTTEHKLIAGQRRLQAYKKLNYKTIPAHIVSIPHTVDSAKPQITTIAEGELIENAARKDFTSSEIVAISEFIQKTRIGHRPKKGTTKQSAIPKGKTRDIVQDLTGASHDTLAKMKRIVKAATEDPQAYNEILQQVDQGKKNINTAYNQIEVKERNKNIKPVKMPKGKFNVLEIDPPWQYQNKSIGDNGRGSSVQQYPTLTPKEILETEVPKIKEVIADDAVLFLWITTPLLNEIIQLGILEALGFKYKTMITWHKKIPTTQFGGHGMGYWMEGQTEHCLVGIKGKIKPFKSDTANFFEAAAEAHSQKPEIIKTIIETVTAQIPNRKMLECYQRKPRAGWTGYGNQIDK